ncbi:MAG: hypothetical protein ABIL40_11185 [candidate division WOR-3 bacterium]
MGRPLETKPRRKSSTLIVLGNGASMGSLRFPKQSGLQESYTSIPSAQNFFYDAFTINPVLSPRNYYINFLAAMDELPYKIFAQAWGRKQNSIHDLKNINVEEVLTFFDIGEQMFKKGTEYQIAFSKAKEALIDFIVFILWKKSKNQYCEYLLEIFSKLTPFDSIVSFNWDTIADFTLARLQNEQYKNYLNVLNENNLSAEKYIDKGLYLKLHGSINWAICKNRKCKLYNQPRLPFQRKNKNLPDYYLKSGRKCQVCGCNSINVCIVPPLSNKLIHKNQFLHKLWLIAREKLLNTKKIVFIGYSFPQTDFYSEWLFRQLNFMTSSRPEIVIINPDAQKSMSFTYKRYHNIFKGFKIKTYETLERYARTVSKTGKL